MEEVYALAGGVGVGFSSALVPMRHEIKVLFDG
jgi:hypothetical protein